MIDLRGFGGWALLVEQPFLRRLRQGQVSGRVFERWLVQERHLYQGLLGLQAWLLKQAPQQHRMILVNALMVTVEELDWLHELEADEPVHPARQTYLDFLARLEEQPYQIGIVALWVRQRSFLDAWLSVRASEGLAGEVSEHWLAPEAQALLHDLGSLALEATAYLEPKEVEYWIAKVLQHEQHAWEMALEFAVAEELK